MCSLALVMMKPGGFIDGQAEWLLCTVSHPPRDEKDEIHSLFYQIFIQ